MAEVPSALIGAGAVILGGLGTGLFAVWNQRANAEAERERWEREAEERQRTRFHEKRLAAYEELLAWSANAFAYFSHQAIQRHEARPDAEAAAVVRSALDSSSAHPQFDKDASRQMMRSRTTVFLLTEAAEVRSAAHELVKAVMAVEALVHDDPNWNTQLAGVAARFSAATQRFQDAAAADLAG